MKLKGLISIAILSMLASSFASAGVPAQLWSCGINDDTSEEGVMAQAGKWKAAAAALPGGDSMSISVNFPVAVGADGDGTDVLLAITWGSFSDYGQWWDAYPSSDVAQMERETMTCHGSSLWESESI